MNVRKSLENRIRGWLPKEPNVTKMPVENRVSKFRNSKADRWIFPVYTIILTSICIVLILYSNFSDAAISTGFIVFLILYAVIYELFGVSKRKRVKSNILIEK